MNQPLFNLGPLQEFIRNRVIPGAAERDSSLTIPLNLYKELFDLGWWTAFLPSEFGGTGVSTVDLCHVLKAIAFGSPSDGYVLCREYGSSCDNSSIWE